VIGGALAMSSTAIVLRQLGDQLELARAHARLALGILLFQDLACAPLLGLATALGSGDVTGPLWLLGVAGRAALALLAVLVIGRLVARPLFREITRHRSTETFTLTVLFVALGGAWATDELGLSMPLGGFLAGMLLAETEFKHQTEAVIKPFHDILLGVFFVSVGMLLDLGELLAQLPLVLLVLVVLLTTKAAVVTIVVRFFVANTRKALRTGIVVCLGGEFGFALVTLLLRGEAVDPRTGQVLLTAIALSMLVGPLLVRYNKLIADTLLRREVAAPTDMALETVATREVAAARGHIIICGFGRVGQNLARIVERRGFTYVGLDADPLRVRDARMAGDPVVYGDAVHPEVLRTLGLEQAAVVVLTFDAPDSAARIVRTVRRLRADVPVLVRTEDDRHLDELLAAGATEVIPGTFETSLALASHLLLFLKVSPSSVLESTEQVRHERYAILRSVFRRRDVPRLPEEDDPPPPREQLYTVVLPPGATAVDRSIRDVGLDHGPVTVSAIRRAGVTGRSPAPETQLREGDVLVLWGRPEDLEQVENRLLMG
jgi:CPA2 family monovalent cation:H+ antiporter-2